MIELHPTLPTRADQAWFWVERWQRVEREADEDIAAGRSRISDGVDEFFDELDADVGG